MAALAFRCFDVFLLFSLYIALKQRFLILYPSDDLSKSVWHYQKDEEVSW
jgi:hypothetical protein